MTKKSAHSNKKGGLQRHRQVHCTFYTPAFYELQSNAPFCITTTGTTAIHFTLFSPVKLFPTKNGPVSQQGSFLYTFFLFILPSLRKDLIFYQFLPYSRYFLRLKVDEYFSFLSTLFSQFSKLWYSRYTDKAQ